MGRQKFLKKIFANLPTFFSPHSLYIQKGRKNGAQFIARRYYNYKGVIIMKNITIKLASIAMASLMSLSAMTTLAADASAQWVETGGKYTYTDDETGKTLTGWQDIDGSRYYLGKNGVILSSKKEMLRKRNISFYYLIIS